MRVPLKTSFLIRYFKKNAEDNPGSASISEKSILNNSLEKKNNKLKKISGTK